MNVIPIDSSFGTATCACAVAGYPLSHSRWDARKLLMKQFSARNHAGEMTRGGDIVESEAGTHISGLNVAKRVG